MKTQLLTCVHLTAYGRVASRTTLEPRRQKIRCSALSVCRCVGCCVDPLRKTK